MAKGRIGPHLYLQDDSIEVIVWPQFLIAGCGLEFHLRMCPFPELLVMDSYLTRCIIEPLECTAKCHLNSSSGLRSVHKFD